MISPHPVPDISGYMGGNDSSENVKDIWVGQTPVNDPNLLTQHP